LSQINAALQPLHSLDLPKAKLKVIYFLRNRSCKIKQGCNFVLLFQKPFSIISFYAVLAYFIEFVQRYREINQFIRAPITSAIPDNIFLLLILMVTPSKPAEKQCHIIVPVLLATTI
jgi:hypothetical protein